MHHQKLVATIVMILGMIVASRGERAAADSQILVAERNQISVISVSGEKQPFYTIPTPLTIMEKTAVEIVGEKIVILYGRTVVILDSLGKELRRIEVPPEVTRFIDFVVLPDGRIAFLDNSRDRIYFVDSKGNYVKTLPFNTKPSKELQNLEGIVVGDALLLSGNAKGEIVKIDPATYEVSIFQNVSEHLNRLGAIAHDNGTFYLCKGTKIYSFSKGLENFRQVAEVPEANITGIAVEENSAFLVVNGASRITDRTLESKYKTKKGILYELNLETGTLSTIREDLNFPGDVAVLSSQSVSEKTL